MRKFVIVVCKMYVYGIFKKILLCTVWLAAIGSSLPFFQASVIVLSVYFMVFPIKINVKIPDH